MLRLTRNIKLLLWVAIISTTSLSLAQMQSDSVFEAYVNNDNIGNNEVFDYLGNIYLSDDQELINEYYNKLVQQEKSWTTGLKTRVSFLSHGDQIGIDEEYLSYRSRLAMGIEWDLFKLGRFAGGTKAAQAELSKEKELLRRSQQEFLISMEGKRLYIEQLYWQELSYWRSVEAKILEEIVQWSNDAYNQNLITHLELQLNTERYERSILASKSLNQDTIDIDNFVHALPRFHLTTSFLDNIDSIKTREYDILQQQKDVIKKGNSHLNEVTLRPKVQYNIVDLHGNQGSAHYMSVGALLVVPFDILKDNKDELEHQKYEEDFNVKKHTAQQEIITQYYQLFRYVEEINQNIDEIAKIQIENAGLVGNYNNVRRDYYDRLLDIIYYKKKICTQKRNAFYTLVYILELSESAEALNHIVTY